METTTYKISDIGEVVGGGTPSTANSDFWGGDIPWISPKDLTGYKSVYISHGENFLTKTGLKSGTKLLPKGTVLFSSRAPIGYVAIASNPICTNQGFKSIICNKEIINPLFLYYYIKGNLDYIKLFGTGATFPEISGAAMRKIKVQIPSLPTQQKIASILSAYDRLIENNTRRIRLLEQMAENLYKEWFVRFRFPEHEKVEMVNGLPKGWERTVASSIIDVMSGGTPKTDHPEFYGGNIPFYTPKDANDSIFVYNTLTNITEEGLTHCNSQLYPRNTLIITARGTVGKLNLLAVPMAMNQSCFALQFKQKENPFFLYYAIRTEIAKLKKIANGGVFDTIIVKSFDHIKLIIPTRSLMDNFNLKVYSILEQVRNLSYQNQLLTHQRDLLLPRLMSGKLEVKS